MHHLARASLRARVSPLRVFSTTTSYSPTSTPSQGAATLLTHSSVTGPTDPPLSTKTLPQYFAEDVLARHASRPALICRKEAARAHAGPPARNFKDVPYLAWDFSEFDRHIRALAKGLLVLGVKKGDRVGVIMGNNRCVLCVIRFGVFGLDGLVVRMRCCSGRVPVLVRYSLRSTRRISYMNSCVELGCSFQIFTDPLRIDSLG